MHGTVVRAGTYTSRQSLIYLNAFAVIVHFLSGILGYLTIKNRDVKVATQAPLFELVSTNSTGSFIKSIPKTIFRSSVFWPFISVEFITAFFHIIYILALMSEGVDQWIKTYIIGSKSANALRWVEYSITAGLMSAFGNLNLGIFDFYYFIKNFSETAAVMLCGLIIELLDQDKKDERIAGIVWNTATVLNVTSVFVILFQIFSSKPHNNFFYYNTIPYSIWFQTFGIIAWQAFKKRGFFADNNYSEKWYILLSLSTKISVFWLGFSTFKQISIETHVAAPTKGVNWKVVRYFSSYFLLGFIALYALYEYNRWQVVKGGSASRRRLSEGRFSEGEFLVESPFEPRPIKKTHKKKKCNDVILII